MSLVCLNCCFSTLIELRKGKTHQRYQPEPMDRISMADLSIMNKSICPPRKNICFICHLSKQWHILLEVDVVSPVSFKIHLTVVCSPSLTYESHIIVIMITMVTMEFYFSLLFAFQSTSIHLKNKLWVNSCVCILWKKKLFTLWQDWLLKKKIIWFNLHLNKISLEHGTSLGQETAGIMR